MVADTDHTVEDPIVESGVGLEGSAGRVEVTRVANTTPLNSFNS